MSDSIIEDSIFRFFAKAFDKDHTLAAEQTGSLPTQWDMAVENGFTSLLCSEERGGAGMGWADAFPLFWGLGYYRVPLPLAEAVIASFVLDAVGREADTSRPIALVDEVAAAPLSIGQAGGTITLRGSATRVHWARAADQAIVGLPGGRIGLWSLGANSVRIVEHTDVTQLPSDTIVFEDAAAICVFDNPFPNVESPLRHFGAIARAAMMVGAAEFALEESVQYAQDRVQFGRPIGKNQALQQQLADMAGRISVARHSAMQAFRHVPAWADGNAPGDVLSAACAKVLAGEAADLATSVAHQVHGALGFTYEHILNFATRRLWAWREDHGTASWWARQIGRQVATEGSGKFWPAMTDPKLYRGLTESAS